MTNTGCVKAKSWQDDDLLARKAMRVLSNNAMPVNNRFVSKEMPTRPVAR